MAVLINAVLELSIFEHDTLRSQTVHWIELCVCVFLNTRDKSLNMLNFCWNDQKKRKNKRRKRKKRASLLLNFVQREISGDALFIQQKSLSYIHFNTKKKC